MKAQGRVGFAPVFFRLFLKGENFKVAQVVFQIGGGFTADVIEDGIRRILVGEAECGQGAVDIFPAGAIVMDGQIQKTVQVNLQIAFQPAELDEKSIRFRSAAFRQDVGRIAIGEIFNIVGPALYETAVIEHIADRIIGFRVFI